MFKEKFLIFEEGEPIYDSIGTKKIDMDFLNDPDYGKKKEEKTSNKEKLSDNTINKRKETLYKLLEDGNEQLLKVIEELNEAGNQKEKITTLDFAESGENQTSELETILKDYVNEFNKISKTKDNIQIIKIIKNKDGYITELGNEDFVIHSETFEDDIKTSREKMMSVTADAIQKIELANQMASL